MTKCGYATKEDGHPCQNDIAPGTTKCAAGHPVSTVTPLPDFQADDGGGEFSGTVDLEDISTPEATNGDKRNIYGAGKNKGLFGNGYTVSLNNLYDAIQAWDEDHNTEFVSGPRNWGDFADDGYYTAAFINHLSNFDVWVSLGDAPDVVLWAEFDELSTVPRSNEFIELTLSKPSSEPTVKVSSPPIYVIGSPDWPSDGLSLRDDLGIDAETDLAQALINLSRFQESMLRSVPYIAD